MAVSKRPKPKRDRRPTPAEAVRRFIEDEDRNFIDVDKYALDEELEMQPRLFLFFSEQLVEARGDLKEAETALELCKSKLDLEVRRRPAKFGIKDVKEASIKSAVLLHVKYKKAERVVRQRTRVVGRLAAAVAALDHRKKSIEKLCDLWAQSYFSKPRPSVEAKEKLDDLEKRTSRRRGQYKRHHDNG